MSKQAMFTGLKYVTKGVSEDIPMETQLILFGMIAELSEKIEKVDYLQSIDLRISHDDNKPIQVIIHTQEIPEYRNEIEIEIDQPVSEKLFMISSYDEEGNEISTLMKRSEY